MCKEKFDSYIELEERLAILEDELNNHYCQIGKIVLEFANKKQPLINSLVDEIIAVRKKLPAFRQNNE